MAATFADLVDEVVAHLHGFTADQEQATTLTSALTDSGTSFTVEDPQSIARGLIQIGSELIYVSSVDQTSSTVTVPAWGRAQQGTTAAAHSSGAKIVTAPRFPEHRVKQVINSVIRSTFPALWQVKTTTLTASSAVITYELPSDARSVISLSWEIPGASDAWQPIKRYRVNQKANVTAFDTGVSVDILEGMTPGRTIQVAYRAEPAELSADADVFATVSGLQESARDVIVWGALAQLLPSLEFARLNSDSVEQSDRQRLVQPGSASAASRHALQMFTLRLEQERNRLLVMYPSAAHLTR